MFALLQMIALPGPELHAQARWLTVVADPSAVVGVDTTTVRRTPQYWEVWVRWSYAKPMKDKTGKAYQSVKSREQIDCRGRRIRTMTSYVYDADGSVVSSWTPDSLATSWSDLIPDSYGEAFLKGFCDDLEFFDGSHSEAVMHYMRMTEVRDSILVAHCAPDPRPVIVRYCHQVLDSAYDTQARLRARTRALAVLDTLFHLPSVDVPRPWPPVLP